MQVTKTHGQWLVTNHDQNEKSMKSPNKAQPIHRTIPLARSGMRNFPTEPARLQSILQITPVPNYRQQKS